MKKINPKKLYDEKELIPLAMMEQFAVHHLGGDIEAAKKIAKQSLDENKDTDSNVLQ